MVDEIGKIGRLVIVTGYSGAGISSSLKYLQDIGYSWMDNPPLGGILALVEGCRRDLCGREGLVIGLHWRNYGHIELLQDTLGTLSGLCERLELVFLEAEAEVLVSRYRETRRRHPTAQNRTVIEAVREEIEALQPLRAMADTVLDTSLTTLPEHRERLQRRFYRSNVADLVIVLRSFGFKFGLNTDADMVLDARFLPNPFYVPELRDATGLDASVQEYLAKDGDVLAFLDRLVDLFGYLLPRYQSEKKHYFTVDIGCTGGHHRSVFLVHHLAQRLAPMGYQVLVRHRELER
ncbi:MAG TPA: RNase adapter RapZ [Magnetococcales bacterium]|nr:RNase adapter RapZ [Magnetococcales bacterium]